MNAIATVAGTSPSSRSDRAAARRLGLGLAIVVALGCDLVVFSLSAIPREQGSPGPNDGAALGFGLLAALLPIASAAPFGWLFGPTLAEARLRGKVGVAIAMATCTMLLGDVLFVVGWSTFASALGADGGLTRVPDVILYIVVGAIAVGPFVIVLVTLPAAVVWVCAFRLLWRSKVRTSTA